MVAKSYQALKKLSEPFAESGRMYIMVQLKSGKEKKVRWYTEKEYQRMYPGEKKKTPGKPHGPQKKVLGFVEDKIYLIKEPIEGYDCRYAKWWGWYIPTPLNNPPVGAKELYWSSIGDEKGYVKNGK